MDSKVPTTDVFGPLVLAVLADGQVRRTREICEAVKARAGLSDEVRAEKLPSGQNRADNRINWAVFGLTHAGALERPGRSMYAITDVGRALDARKMTSMSEKDLVGLPAWDAYLRELAVRKAERGSSGPGTDGASDPVEVVAAAQPPEESIEALIAANDDAVAAELVERLRAESPEFFEQVVLDVLIAIGYGGAMGRATRLGRSGDGGIDGVIEQDTLGLERIYVQAKRYAATNHVGRPELQAFVGALHGRDADRGVFITTSTFTADARAFAERMRSTMVTIDGTKLANLMLRFRVGVQVRRMFHLVEVDEDYFES